MRCPHCNGLNTKGDGRHRKHLRIYCHDCKRIENIVERGGVALVDSSGKEVAFHDVSLAKKHTPNQALGNMIEDLSKRQ